MLQLDDNGMTMPRFIVDKEQPYSNGAYFMKALPVPENDREPEDEADRLFIQAMKDLSEGRISEGKAELEQSYEYGDLNSGNTLAYGYDAGWFGEKDHRKANKMFRDLTRKLYPASMRNYAIGLIMGTGVRKDEDRGIFWLKGAADRGDSVAMANLAQFLAFSDTISHNYTMARIYVLKAVNAGEPEGANTLGRMYEKGVCFKKDPGKAFQWYNLAYEREKNSAILGNIARCYKRGFGVEKDEAIAFELFKMADEMDRA